MKGTTLAGPSVQLIGILINKEINTHVFCKQFVKVTAKCGGSCRLTPIDFYSKNTATFLISIQHF